jgi:trimethylamine--corrinoid protein Co-methyltransferase
MTLSIEAPSIKPIQPRLRLEVLGADQVQAIQDATLETLERIGINFPSLQALEIFADHGAQVDWKNQIVHLPPDLVVKALGSAPRSYNLAGRRENLELILDGKRTYFGTDGSGTMTLDLESGKLRPSCLEDVVSMARAADFLDSISFYWPMVSAQEFGELAPLYELEACFNNTAKHVQMETVIGERQAQYAVRMAEIVAGGEQEMRLRPPLSCLVCTVAPLGQDKDSIEAALVYARAGIPVGFMAMPNMGASAPATASGALVVGNAEVVSAMTLIQLAVPGAPVFHSLLASLMDPRTAAYLVSIPDKYLCNAAAVQLAHDWGMPSLAGAFGNEYEQPATWELGRDNVYTALLAPLSGAEMVVAAGLLRASTLLTPEQIIFDDETYHIHKRLAEGIDTSPEHLALDVIAEVGPRGHYLAQKHTRKHIREIWIPELSHPRPAQKEVLLPDIRERARARFDRILAEHNPESLDESKRSELQALLVAATRELGN